MSKGLRKDMLVNDLVNYRARRWKVNLPFRDYSVRVEDFIPAFSGIIGKTSLIAAFCLAWTNALEIKDISFINELIRVELIVASIIVLLTSSFFNPLAAPPGTLAPMIPLVSIMAAQGIHPFVLGILISILGIVVAFSRKLEWLVDLTGPSTKSGIILLFSIMGISSTLENLKSWTIENQVPIVLYLLLGVGIVIYVYLSKINKKWLILPICILFSLIITLVIGITPTINSHIGIPKIKPYWYWDNAWGIGFGNRIINYAKALPYALLVLIIWPIDALPLRMMQEQNYPKEAHKAYFNISDTFIIVSIRNLIGTLLGGVHISAVWRSYMIPLAIVKRPIGGSALLLGVLGIAFAILGYPIDIAVFPPLLLITLLFGIHIPLFETGLCLSKQAPNTLATLMCIIAGLSINPIIGWLIGVIIEKNKSLNFINS